MKSSLWPLSHKFKLCGQSTILDLCFLRHKFETCEFFNIFTAKPLPNTKFLAKTESLSAVVETGQKQSFSLSPCKRRE
jgi:hypothetical protein